ncbi:MAG: tyrosine-type recombinase/integrase [Anaerolineae bacterium]
MSVLSTTGQPSSAEQPTDSVNDTADLMLSHLELSPLTIRTYRHGLNALIRCLHIQDNQTEAADRLDPYPLSRITEDTLAIFGRWLREAYPDPRPGFQGSATRTSRTYLVAARHLMNWLDLRGLLPEGVSFDRMVRRIDQGRGQRRQGYRQRKADPEAIRVLTHYLRLPLPKDTSRRLALLRNRALMAVLYDTGMRISEALALTRDDVQDGRATKVRLTHTKNGHPRTVFLSDESRRLIREYARERSDSRYAPLFASHGRNKLKASAITPSHAWLLVKKAAQAEGLDENTSPHSLRHRRAQDLLDEGMPLEWVAALLGHQHTDTTRIVYAWETDEDRLADMVATYGRLPSEVSGAAESAIAEEATEPEDTSDAQKSPS